MLGMYSHMSHCESFLEGYGTFVHVLNLFVRGRPSELIRGYDVSFDLSSKGPVQVSRSFEEFEVGEVVVAVSGTSPAGRRVQFCRVRGSHLVRRLCLTCCGKNRVPSCAIFFGL